MTHCCCEVKNGSAGTRCRTCGYVILTPPAPPEAAYVPKVGDRVRFTAEGVVTDTGRFDTTLVTLDRCLNPNAIQVGVGTWEKLPDPLPTTPGSVVRVKASGVLRFRNDAGWITGGGALLNSIGDAHHYDVLFDAGATP